jgi:hypothetical protein
MDVHDPARGLFGRREPKISNHAFDALVADVMTTEPYASAQRVFWVVDNGTIHRGDNAIERLQGAWPNLILVHLPRHASWLNQIEIFFSILARKALTPADFDDVDELADRVLGFQHEFATTAQPSTGPSTRQDLHRRATHRSAPGTSSSSRTSAPSMWTARPMVRRATPRSYPAGPAGPEGDRAHETAVAEHRSHVRAVEEQHTGDVTG